MNNYIYDELSLAELEAFFSSIGEKPYRAKQLFQYLQKEKGRDLQYLTTFSKTLKETLLSLGSLTPMDIKAQMVSKVDGTVKYVLKLSDGAFIEAVYMPHSERHTICISSQVGCRMGCSFCASTKEAFGRNLTVGELVRQITIVEEVQGIHIDNIVIMGIGEPLDNYENIVKFIRLITDEKGANRSQRSITLSTCGLVEKIYDLSREHLKINLAISLHYAFDGLRSQYMPIGKRHSIDELLGACHHYFDTTGRRVSFEYVLIEGVNDRDADLQELIRLFKGKNMHINLIPLNSIREFDHKPTNHKRMMAFKEGLNQRGIVTTVRQKKGSDIDGACGQLRNYFTIETKEG